MWSPADWKAFKAKYQWLLKWDCGHCFGPISIQLLYPQWCRWPSKKKKKKGGGGVITNAHRRPFNNVVSRRGAWRSQHCLFFKVDTIMLDKKIQLWHVLLWCDVTHFLYKLESFHEGTRKLSNTVSLSIWSSTATVIRGIHLCYLK